MHMIAALAPVRPHHANRGRWVVFGASVAIDAIAGLAQFNTRSGFDVGFCDVYRQAAGASLATSSARILDRYLNVLPTLTIGDRADYVLNQLIATIAKDREFVAWRAEHPTEAAVQPRERRPTGVPQPSAAALRMAVSDASCRSSDRLRT